MLDKISEFWCRSMHTKAMWPIHGKYVCSQCLREHRLEWEGPARASEYADPSLAGERTAAMAPMPSLVQ